MLQLINFSVFKKEKLLNIAQGRTWSVFLINTNQKTYEEDAGRGLRKEWKNLDGRED